MFADKELELIERMARRESSRLDRALLEAVAQNPSVVGSQWWKDKQTYKARLNSIIDKSGY